MQKFDVYEITGDLYAVVQADHLLDLNSVTVVPVLPRDAYPALRKLTVDVQINGRPYLIRAHMPLTIEARHLRRADPVYRLTADQGQRVMDGLNTILWGF
ncbi:CcdB family protein [Pseudooceanicola nitratireducens]|uniref:CcdB family protein n=1 Tax=Pseudooceanicola nitratireducens TaxID=517719 RepID=UPI003C7A2D55